MGSRASVSQRDAAVDALKWASAAALVASASALRTAIREHGLMSEEARLAQVIADAKLREYKRWRMK